MTNVSTIKGNLGPDAVYEMPVVKGRVRIPYFIICGLDDDILINLVLVTSTEQEIRICPRDMNLIGGTCYTDNDITLMEGESIRLSTDGDASYYFIVESEDV